MRKSLLVLGVLTVTVLCGCSSISVDGVPTPGYDSNSIRNVAVVDVVGQLKGGQA